MLRLIAVFFFWIILPETQSSTSQKINSIIQETNSENAQFGISVRDQNGHPVFEYMSQIRLIPASTFKLITTLAIIEELGDDYKFETRIVRTGEILGDGTLSGDIIVIGSGDPSLGSPEFQNGLSFEGFLNAVVGFVKKEGITCIDGSILVHDAIYDRRPIHPSWAWDDLTNYYTSGAWGFNIHENFYFLHFGRSQLPDQATTIELIEPGINLTIKNDVRTGPLRSGDNAYIYGDPYATHRWVEGTIPPGTGKFTIKGAIPDPPLFGAYHLHQKLLDNDITAVSFGVIQDLNDSIQPMGSLYSESLGDLISHANERSNNMYCESFFRMMGVQSGVQGDFASGTLAIESHLKYIGLDMNGIHIEDGSGLSSRNRISPDFMTSFINSKLRTLGDTKMKKYIPKVGEKGSVQNFLNGFTSQQSSWLKSGSINNVLAYAGLMESKSGKLMSISIMANGHLSNRKLRKQMEKIIEVLHQDL